MHQATYHKNEGPVLLHCSIAGLAKMFEGCKSRAQTSQTQKTLHRNAIRVVDCCYPSGLVPPFLTLMYPFCLIAVIGEILDFPPKDYSIFRNLYGELFTMTNEDIKNYMYNFIVYESKVFVARQQKIYI